MTMKTKTRTKLASAVLASSVGLAALAGFATPASAADTTATFTLTAGGLSITAPASAALGSGAPGSTASAQMGTVKVDDTRGALVATWTAKVSSTAFKTGGGTTAETIANTSAQYWSGDKTASSGTNVFLPGQLLDANKATLGATATTAFSATGGAGNNSASWNPTFIVNIPAAAVAGTYTGTVTHSVA